MTAPDLQTALEKILDKAFLIGSFDIGVIRLLDKNGDTIEPVASRGYQNPENIYAHRRRAREATTGRFLLRVMDLKKRRIEENVPKCGGLSVFKKEGIQSAIVIPVRAKEEVLGVLQLGSRTPKKFQPNEVRLLETIGSQMGIAVQKSQLFEDTQRNLARIRALHEIDKVINSTPDLHAVLDILLEKVELCAPYVAASTVRLLNRESGGLDRVACRNVDYEEWKLQEVSQLRGLSKDLIETKSPVIVTNVLTDPRIQNVKFYRKYGLVSQLSIPLIVKDRILGILAAYTKEEHKFSNEEVDFLSTLADQAAIAINNSQLYEKVGQQVKDLRQKTFDLERAGKVKDEFLSVMSHELRTPLNVVVGYSGMIMDGMLGEVNQLQKDALGKIIRRTNDQLTMINNILFSTVLEVERIGTESHTVNLSDILDQLRTSRDQLIDNDVALHWDYPSNLPTINTDGTKLKHILQNLIDNALKFTPKGSVTVSARLVEVGGQGSGISASPRPPTPSRQFVEFKVADTGIGIPKEMIPIIFEKFRQADSSETRSFGGVGLGLYIVKQFAELLGGKAEVESKAGKGSTFTVTIPCGQSKGAGGA